MPLQVPDDKLTRWHALFEVDKVPEIEISPLPQKSNQRKIYSAQEALELVKNKCDKRVLNKHFLVANSNFCTCACAKLAHSNLRIFYADLTNTFIISKFL